MFRASSAHLQEDTVVHMQHMVLSRSMRLSVHFEYLDNRACGVDVTWQQVRGDLTVHPSTVTLPWG